MSKKKLSKDRIIEKDPLKLETVNQWKEKFKADPKNILALNACAKNDPFEISISRERLLQIPHMFTHKMEGEGKPITNQKNSSRCWLFAALNTIRTKFMKLHNIEEFEFSQAYLFYWDKIERCYFFLNTIVEISLRGERPEGRLMSFLLKNPIDEGGQWNMFVNLVLKYGLMPKKAFPDNFSCEASLRMNTVLKSKLREYAKILRDMIRRETKENIKIKINEQMSEVYNIVGICIGIPDETFNWEYYDKSKKYQSTGQITPLKFYEDYVKTCYNIQDKFCVVNDPRDAHMYKQTYTVDYLNNMVGGKSVLYNNQPMRDILRMVKKSVVNGEPVWFGCDVGKRANRKHGILDLEINDFKTLFGVDIQTTMPKSDRLLYGESAMTHAMVITGMHSDENGITSRFRVENSWGEEVGDKGYIVMTDDWFINFAFEIVVDRFFIPDEILKFVNLDPVSLPPWDPMGSLAQ